MTATEFEAKLAELQEALDAPTVKPDLTHIRTKLPKPKRGNGFYKVNQSGGDKALCGGEITSFDVGYGEARYASVRVHISCPDCIALREAKL